MEFIMIHKPLAIIPPEVMEDTLKQVGKLLSRPSDFVPGGKLIASYGARGKSLVVCIWEAPSTEALCPFMEQLVMAGWETDIIPADNMKFHVDKLGKALQAVRKSKNL